MSLRVNPSSAGKPVICWAFFHRDCKYEELQAAVLQVATRPVRFDVNGLLRKTLCAIVYKSLNFIVTKHNRDVQKQQLLVWLIFLTQSSNFHFPDTMLRFVFARLGWSLVIIIL